MLGRFGRKRRAPAHYRFYVWEGGSYVAASGGDFPSDQEAIVNARKHVAVGAGDRPASLEAPHLHIIRQDGVHIMTVELAGEFEVAVAGAPAHTLFRR